jgi:hypothetical protein
MENSPDFKEKKFRFLRSVPLGSQEYRKFSFFIQRVLHGKFARFQRKKIQIFTISTQSVPLGSQEYRKISFFIQRVLHGKFARFQRKKIQIFMISSIR